MQKIKGGKKAMNCLKYLLTWLSRYEVNTFDNDNKNNKQIKDLTLFILLLLWKQCLHFNYGLFFSKSKVEKTRKLLAKLYSIDYSSSLCIKLL